MTSAEQNHSFPSAAHRVIEPTFPGCLLSRLSAQWAARTVAERCCAHFAHFFLPSGPNCSMKLHKSSASFSFLIPGNTILVPGIFRFGIFDVFLEGPFVPDDPGLFVRIRVIVAWHRA